MGDQDQPPWAKRVRSPSSRPGKPRQWTPDQEQFGLRWTRNQIRPGFGYQRLDRTFPPILTIGFNVIVSLAMAAVGVRLILGGVNIPFAVVWLAILAISTVVNIRKQLLRRRLTRISRHIEKDRR